MIVFVRRVGGVVQGVYSCAQPGYAEEQLQEDHPEVVAYLAPKPPIDYSNLDNLDKTLKAVGLLMRDYCNQLQAGTYATKSIAQLKADFMAKYNAL